jgi:hypothetical protein
MSKRDDEKTVIDIDCFCVDKGCKGNLYIQPDKIDGTRVFMVEVLSSGGDENAYMWITIAQLQQLQNELTALIDEFDKL